MTDKHICIDNLRTHHPQRSTARRRARVRSREVASYDFFQAIESEIKQENNAFPSYHAFKAIQYQYDLVSGKVNKVIYQPHKIDQFIYKYNYDADNRITEVLSATDENDNEISYYT